MVPGIKRAAIALTAVFTLFAADSESARAETAPATAQSQPDDSQYLDPEFLSTIAGQPVYVLKESDLGGQFAELVRLRDQTGAVAVLAPNNPSLQAEMWRRVGDKIDEVGELAVQTLAGMNPELVDFYNRSDDEMKPHFWGMINFMIDSQSAYLFNRAFCHSTVFGGCVVFALDASLPDAATADRLSSIAGTNALSRPQEFAILDVWSDLLTDSGRVEYVHLPTNDPGTMAVAYPMAPGLLADLVHQTGLVTEADLDSYFLLKMTKIVMKPDYLSSDEMLSYYLYLAGVSDAEKARELLPRLHGEVAAVHTLIHETISTGRASGADMNAVREDLRRQLVDIVQDPAGSEAARFYAGAFLQMYAKRGDPLPANAPADFPFYKGTLREALAALRGAELAPVPAPAPLP